jgi:hypothetical protein
MNAKHNIMMLSLLGKGLLSLNEFSTQDYKDSVLEFQQNMQTLRFGYVPGVILHHFHGSKKNRHYGERWKILVEHEYSPLKHISYDKNGILVPTEQFPNKLKEEIYAYFASRNEDDP